MEVRARGQSCPAVWGDPEPAEGRGKAVLSLDVKVRGSNPRAHLKVELAHLLALGPLGR